MAGSERWEHVEQLLDRALDLAPADRVAFLNQACEGDPALRTEVEGLLRAAEQGSSFLQEPAPAYAAPLVSRVAEAEALIPGARLGTYQIERELGRGGMATVYLAHDRRHNRPVAIKLLHPELAQTIGPARFLREIEVIARLQHPHILPLLDSGEAEGRLFYVMPYVEGESLRHWLIREKQLPLETAVRIAREAAGALDYAHRHGIIHRDIKPENILLADRQAVVADFGIARAIHVAGSDSLTGTGLVLGTPAYMSPEQAAGTEELDGRTDIYSLGCVTYEMLAGQAPFTGARAEQVIHQHLAAEPPAVTTLRPGIPPEVARAIGRAMAKLPADRFETAGGFAQALASAGEAGPAGRASPSARRLRPAILGVAAAVALLGVGIASLQFRSKPVSLDPNLVAIAPFDVLDPGLSLWREGLVDYLSRNFDGAGSLRTVSPTVVMRRWRGRADAVSGAELGRRTGARLVVVGQLVAAGPQRVRLRGILVDATNGRVLVEVDRSEEAERVDRLGDSLTVDLLRELDRTASGAKIKLASVGTQSLPALKAFLQGEQWLRRAAWDSAGVQYERAVALDSTFAVAMRRLGLTRGWRGQFLTNDSLALRAGRFIRGLAPRDSLLLTADSAGSAYSDTVNGAYWSHMRRKFSTLEEAARRYPDDPEIWYQLGEARLHNDFAAATTLTEKLDPFDRAIALDSSFAPAYVHAIELALLLHGPTGAAPYLRGYSGSAGGVSEGNGIELAGLLLGSGSTGSAAVQRLIDTASANTLFDAVLTLDSWPDSAESAVRLLRTLAKGRRGVGVSGDTIAMRIWLAGQLSFRGHLHEARAFVGGRFGWWLIELALLGAVPSDTATSVAAHWLESGDARSSFSSTSPAAFGASPLPCGGHHAGTRPASCAWLDREHRSSARPPTSSPYARHRARQRSAGRCFRSRGGTRPRRSGG